MNPDQTAPLVMTGGKRGKYQNELGHIYIQSIVWITSV